MIIFRNPGLIDMAVVETMGVNVKDGDSPIGRFGTGLKFAISTILRDGGEIEIWRGGRCHKIGTVAREIRGKSFDIVTLDGQPLGYTTDLGRDWLPWMAFRELATNVMDEQGEYSIGPAQGEAMPPMPGPDETVIVAHGPGIVDAYHTRGTIILESPPIAVTSVCDIHEGPSNYVYFRGVRVHELRKPTLYTYNVKVDIELTEDRTAKVPYMLHAYMAMAIEKAEDDTIIRRAITCGEDYFEDHLSLDGSSLASKQFGDVLSELATTHATVPNINKQALGAARNMALSTMTPGNSKALSGPHAEKLFRAKSILKAAGFEIDAFPVIVVDGLGNGAIGLAKDGKIFITLAAFEKGAREVAATILEEYAHLRSGQEDCSRGFQNWLFDQLLNQIEHRSGQNF